MKRENDILSEKHALNKIKEKFYDRKNEENMPSVKIIGTFKDKINLYFLTDMSLLWVFPLQF